MLFMNSQKLKPVFTVDQHGTIAFILLFSAFLLTGLFSMFLRMQTKLILARRIKLHLLELSLPYSLPFRRVSLSGMIFHKGYYVRFVSVWLCLAVGLYL